MAQVDTKSAQRDKLFNLLVAREDPKNLELQIAQSMAVMEEEDVEIVNKRFADWKKTL